MNHLHYYKLQKRKIERLGLEGKTLLRVLLRRRLVARMGFRKGKRIRGLLLVFLCSFFLFFLGVFACARGVGGVGVVLVWRGIWFVRTGVVSERESVETREE